MRSDCRSWVVAYEDTPRLRAEYRKSTRIRSGAQRRTVRRNAADAQSAVPTWRGNAELRSARCAIRCPAAQWGEQNRLRL